MPLVSLLVALSFVFIPVRCDASTAPHSIFVSPNMLNVAGGHQHHGGGVARAAPVQSIAHHSPISHDADTTVSGAHQHGPDGAKSTDSPASEQATAHLGGDNHPGSQQPVGATLDLPPTTVTSESNLLPLLEGESRLLIFGPTSTLHGISHTPENPPPEIA